MLPEGFEELTDINERAQQGDLYFDEDDRQWHGVTWGMRGRYLSQLAGLARRSPPKAEPAAPPKTKRIRRTRKPKE